MIIMIDEYKEKIKIELDNLATMPKGNAKNIRVYREKLSSIKNTYEQDLKLVYEEIKRRNIKYKESTLNKELDVLNNSIIEFKEMIPLLNTFSSSYTKSGLAMVLYDLSHFYTVKLDEVNTDILKAILIFKKVGINLDEKSFNYSYYANIYMNKFLSSINGNTVDNDKLKVFFEDIYWKCPDLITSIVVNFKYLYFANKRKFDDYYANLITYLHDNNIFNKYIDTYVNRDNLLSRDSYTIINNFLTGKEDINGYSSDKINSEYKKIFSSSTGNNEEDIVKLLYTLTEYKYYLKFKYIIEDIKNLHIDRVKYKNGAVKVKKEITKLERKIFKLSRSIYRIKDKNSKFDKLNGEVNNIILKIRNLYIEYDNKLFLEDVLKLGDNPTLYDMLLLGSANYDYLVNLLKDEDMDIDLVNKKIDELYDFIYYPYINIINNMWLKDERDIKHVIMDRYNLFGFDISEDELEEGNIDNLIKTTKTILVYNSMKKLGIEYDKIKFVISTNDIVK